MPPGGSTHRGVGSPARRVNTTPASTSPNYQHPLPVDDGHWAVPGGSPTRLAGQAYRRMTPGTGLVTVALPSLELIIASAISWPATVAPSSVCAARR